MANSFEYEMLKAFRNYLQGQAVVSRDKQAKFTSQDVDIKIQSAMHQNVGIECKSIKENASSKLYFSQHFSESDGQHQVENITSWLEMSGNIGLLAVEVRRGQGNPKEAYLMKWPTVEQAYRDGEYGFGLEGLSDMEDVRQLERTGQEYVIDEETWDWIQEGDGND